MTDVERLESLSRRINELKVKKMASEKESERLREELEQKKDEIRKRYGVDIVDFQAAIDVMKKEYSEKLEELERNVSEAEKSVEG